MTDLMELLEKATGPDRTLDADVATAAGLKVYQVKRRDGQGSWTRYEFWDGSDVPAYTASIDAALTLVPKDYFGSIPFNRNCDAWVRADNEAPLIYGRGNTSAIALCIAALKARALVTV